ncbi:ATP-binding protein [Cryobacterium sp. PAMC25264]|uniref:ATP-binding protein n=1 Tax=Cryobacterium sp. PAMC25264 TaxID=2861288 RepID=UPI001C638638|nr:ATP-binding protein [Cryobacterium sp. PAMC25264]QYF75099.1 ATP-binding protein [Cryobacterium sp. PAMC25264]
MSSPDLSAAVAVPPGSGAPADATGSGALLAPVLHAVRAFGRHRAGGRAVVLIDGPSGAGKSTLADALVTAWPGPVAPTMVRLDDIYPGWAGLEAAIEHIRTQVLVPRRDGAPARWRRFDWGREAAAEWHAVPADRPLIVEGCGTLARAHESVSDVRVWLDADDGIRKQRALARDGGVFEAHWDQWQQDWAGYRDRETPERQATVRLLATPPRSGPQSAAADTPWNPAENASPQ